MVVFPEDGLYGSGLQRNVILPYLEDIPDPKDASTSLELLCPCNQVIFNVFERDAPFSSMMFKHEFQADNRNEVQQQLSCLAGNTGIYIAAVMGDVKTCPDSAIGNRTDTACPKDGRYQYNTAVIYDQHGCLVARYHKYNLFFEKQFDAPKQASCRIEILILIVTHCIISKHSKCDCGSKMGNFKYVVIRELFLPSLINDPWEPPWIMTE